LIEQNELIEEKCDDLRMALQDLAANGPNVEDHQRVYELLRALSRIADVLGNE
jgi:hypothetical protein